MPKNISGKLVIIAVLAVALAGAGASWWFRYSATHKAARFWGPEAVRLIRDAPDVKFGRLPFSTDQVAIAEALRNRSNTPGMTHLRNALLEDRSFDWNRKPPLGPADELFADGWSMIFGDPATLSHLTILFTADCDWAMRNTDGDQTRPVISCAPISAGLTAMFRELTSETAAR